MGHGEFATLLNVQSSLPTSISSNCSRQTQSNRKLRRNVSAELPSAQKYDFMCLTGRQTTQPTQIVAWEYLEGSCWGWVVCKECSCCKRRHAISLWNACFQHGNKSRRDVTSGNYFLFMYNIYYVLRQDSRRWNLPYKTSVLTSAALTCLFGCQRV